MTTRSTVLAVGLAMLVFWTAGAAGFLLPEGLLSARTDNMPAITLDAATTSIRWAGYSTLSYTGTLGGTGFKGANQVCDTLYPGSHWASSFEILHLGTQYPWSQSVWLADFWYDQSKDCGHFLNSLSSDSATNADTKTIYPGGINSGWSCSASFYLPCVYQP